MMKNLRIKQTKGITLIALVITIIILLILAGVTLSVTFNQDGILQKAERATNKWNEASQNEADYLSKFERLYDDYSGERRADYADLDGDGVADGVIYADLTKGKTVTWDAIDVEQYIKDMTQLGANEDAVKERAEYIKDMLKQVSYTIPTVTSGLKEYEVEKTDYVGDFGTGKLIKQKEGTTGLDRYYIMALEDVNLPNGIELNGEKMGINKKFKGAYWYKNAYGTFGGGLMTDYETFTSADFGKGKENTKKMIARWRANGTVEGSEANYGEGSPEDIWGQIGAPTNLNDIVWFVPSFAEFFVFGGELGINNANYFRDFKLSPFYWTSSQMSENGVGSMAYLTLIDERWICQFSTTRSLECNFLTLLKIIGYKYITIYLFYKNIEGL